MKADEIRERFLAFFEKQGHTRHPSDSLVPANDPSLLFTGAGMNQFKDMFLGRGSLPFKRAVTSQKCLRAGDLEIVGKSIGHQTFFEMLGNFSFGDYFKREAIPWHWELLTRELKIPSEMLYVSVYTGDEETATIWRDTIGLPEDKIKRFGADENFWPANAPTDGPNGPCGPCSEIYYDFGAKYGCGSPTCDVGCGCNRYVEIANLVFTQFDRQEDGTLAPLPQKNIDTGSGLERWAAVLQGVQSNFDTDLFLPIIKAERDLLKTKDTSAEVLTRLRRIADHVRTLTFCIADNAMPSNEGRGYVVRRILRTALRDGVKLGQNDAFLHRLVPVVIQVMKSAYPHLTERRTTIVNLVKGEEEAFLQTLHRGTALLEEEIKRRKKGGEKTLTGRFTFELFDSHGFPIELSEDLAREHGLRVDRQEFEKILTQKKEGTQAVTSEDIFGSGAFGDIKRDQEPPTQFLGYTIPMVEMEKPREATVRRIIRLGADGLKKYAESKRDLAAVTVLLNAGKLVDEAGVGSDVAVLLDRTPFYGESGGQIGDSGKLEFDGGHVRVEDTKRPDGYFFHLGKVAGRPLKTGAGIQASIDAERRVDIMRNHTGTHILQASLRTVLGSHIEQAGSIVEPDKLRFDFAHYNAMTPEEIRKVEDACNHAIFADIPVAKVEMSMAEAKKKGAIAFFGEKYGDRVRVVTVGDDVSIELCGGTHLEKTGTISQLKITSESSIQRGVRRIEAVTGPKAVEHARLQYDSIQNTAAELSCPREDIPKKIANLKRQLQDLRQEASRLRRSGGGAAELEGILAGAKDVNGEKVIWESFEDRNVKDIRALMDEMFKKKKIGAALLASGAGEKPVFIIGVREDLVKKGLKAGEIAREIGKKCGGGGGGRDRMAQAGASDASKIPTAFSTFEGLVRAALK